MCARFSLAAPDRIIVRYPRFRSRLTWPPRFNIAPTQEVLAVRNDAAGEIAPDEDAGNSERSRRHKRIGGSELCSRGFVGRHPRGAHLHPRPEGSVQQ